MLQEFIKKYEIYNFNDCFFHKNIILKLKNLISSSAFQNLYIYGKQGVGKDTIVNCILTELYGHNIKKKTQIKTIKNLKNVNIDVEYLQSMYHYEINMEILQNYDYSIINLLLKFIIENQNISFNTDEWYRIIWIKNAHILSKRSQHSIRRLLENKTNTYKFIFTSNYLSNSLFALKSRCIHLNLPTPSYTKFKEFLILILEKEKIIINENELDKLIKHSNYNIHISLIELKLFNLQKKANIIDDLIISEKSETILDWKFYIHKITEITENKEKFNLIDLRTNLFNLIIHCIPSSEILYETLIYYSKKLENDTHTFKKILEIYSNYDYNIKKGNKEIIHLESLFIHIANVLLY